LRATVCAAVPRDGWFDLDSCGAVH
jgi:hypothetical protein